MHGQFSGRSVWLLIKDEARFDKKTVFLSESIFFSCIPTINPKFRFFVCLYHVALATFGSFGISKAGKDISELDQGLILQSNMCHLDHGTRLTDGPSFF